MNDYHKIKDMIDLDVRLDSSLEDDDYGYLSRLQQLEKHTLVPLNLENNLDDYLSRRNDVLELLQTEEALNYATNALIHRLYRRGYDYIELSITPVLHTKSGLTVRRVIDCILDAVDEAMEKCPDILVNLVIFCRKEGENKENFEVITNALKFKNKGVVAIGFEGGYGRTLSFYLPSFRRIKKGGLPIAFELHDRLENDEAIHKLIKYGVNRIIAPYGYQLNSDLIQKVFSNNVYFEYRPYHDVINGYMEKIQDLPLKYNYQYGLNAFVAGCSYTICSSSLINNFYELQKAGLIDKETIRNSVSLSIQASFASLNEKARLVKNFVKDFEFFYRKTID